MDVLKRLAKQDPLKFIRDFRGNPASHVTTNVGRMVEGRAGGHQFRSLVRNPKPMPAQQIFPSRKVVN